MSVNPEGGRPHTGVRADNVRAHAREPADYLSGVSLDTSECSRLSPDGICSTDAVRNILDMVVASAPEGRAPEGRATTVAAAAAVLGCDSESCVVTHTRTQKIARDLKLEGVLKKEIALRFKPAGPRNGTALLSNVHIDAVLRQWADEFATFYACPFAMADFDTDGDELGRVKLDELRSGRYRTFGCVMNTDVSSGPGTHWVAIFVDMRPAPGGPEPWTVEYFNSAGRPPARAVVRWMERQRAALLLARAGALEGAPGPVETWAVTSVAHQRSQTECGNYALFYIRRRLEGVTPQVFMEGGSRIPDSAMVKFRQYLFRARDP